MGRGLGLGLGLLAVPTQLLCQPQLAMLTTLLTARPACACARVQPPPPPTPNAPRFAYHPGPVMVQYQVEVGRRVPQFSGQSLTTTLWAMAALSVSGAAGAGRARGARHAADEQKPRTQLLWRAPAFNHAWPACLAASPPETALCCI